ncbi:Dabb family protein [Francisella tularensis]|nr:hypothetical protein CYL81_00140 [Francisella tularensis]AYF35880.1 hypothetical protein CUZ57_00140 [Francisella tularensis subsp. holarctica]OPH23934.1 hypothetical protein BSY87_03655 [Francisella tularensis subsp. holarctica FSC022]AZP06635.1 Dabb family protein [Francisella tularensis]AZP08703.1 Dabb family protein [Francisella tularensis]
MINAMDKLQALSSKLNFKNFSHGYNNSTKRLNKDFNYAFSMEFNSTAERDNYESDPIHINIAKQHLLPLINNTESILVFDF